MNPDAPLEGQQARSLEHMVSLAARWRESAAEWKEHAKNAQRCASSIVYACEYRERAITLEMCATELERVCSEANKKLCNAPGERADDTPTRQ
jgi:hypothetical protein